MTFHNMFNRQIAEIFLKIADTLELKNENIFKVRAYRTAAQNITGLTRQLSEIYEEDPSKIGDIPGIGKDLKAKIIELIETGELKFYDELITTFPPGFIDLLNISRLGPKKLRKLQEELGVEDIEDLEKACKTGKLEKIEGMGKKTQDKLLEGIKHFRKKAGRMLLPEAYKHAEAVMAYLKGSKNFKRIEKAGSLRRGKDTVGDIDILALVGNSEKAMDLFVKYPGVDSVIAKGSTKSSISLKGGVQIDLRIVENKSFGAALVYFTGSKEHNIKIRHIAKKLNYKVNEYGVFSTGKSGKEKYIKGKTEEEVYDVLGLQWIPPELRENSGEIEASQKKEVLGTLLKLKDIKGDLHVHSTASDGRDTLENIAKAAEKRGYKYLAVTDHSKLVKVAGGMDEKQLLKRADQVRKISKKFKGVKILMGVEVDILGDGKLDLEDYALKEMDIVIAAIHSKFSLDKDFQTARVLKAMNNKYVNVLAHPSGRLITTRNPLELDFDKIFRKAADKNIFLEINTHGDRIDLNDVNCRRAKELGAKLVINTDAHEIAQLDNIVYGVMTARRGWIEKKDVLNTYSLEKVLKMLKRK